jgi:DNA polymerase III epsilon subunit-like protein
VLGDYPPLQGYSLDALCRRFDVAPYDRHTAPGDAFLTAQVFLHLLRLAERAGRDTLGALCEPYSEPDGDWVVGCGQPPASYPEPAGAEAPRLGNPYGAASRTALTRRLPEVTLRYNIRNNQPGGPPC